MEKESNLPGGSRLIDIPIVSDSRGSLCFATNASEIPFPIQRVFWIYDVPTGEQRGGHSHRTCAEVVVAVKGRFTMTVDDGCSRCSVVLDSPSKGILIPAGLWCELSDFAPGTVVLVMASQAYDATGYINDYTLYKKERNA
ncbi:MAG: FdtA/QdtA family cupin domain-containing protein [Bacteroidaceae bacterium]|nr:FdtA/QdtA family cupin domain-containing protein [Bacteroidaceae bacterium]